MKRKITKVLKIIGISLSSLVFVLFLFILVYSKIGTSTINAEIEGLGTKLFGVSHYNGFKLAFSFNDKLRVKISPTETDRVLISPILETLQRKVFRSKDISVYLEPSSEIFIKGISKGNSIDYDFIKGNNLNFQFNELRKFLLPHYEKESQLLYESWKLRKKNHEKSVALKQQFDSLRFHVVAPLRTEWAKQHLHYELTPQFFLESHIPRDTVMKYFDLMPDNTKDSKFGQHLGSVISGWEKTKIGEIAPYFEQKSFSNEYFNLDSLKGKYAVIYFWGTWCASCMHEIPKMKDFYNMYNDKIEFVSIACNDNYNKWASVVENHDLKWINILNDKSQNDLALLYGIQRFPTKFIIDKNGKIIEKFTGATDDFYQRLRKIAES